MSGTTREVIVVGGGVSGLTTAWHLHRLGVDVALLEAEARVGGCTKTERRGGFLLEKGPFNVIVRDPSFQALLEAMADRVNVVTASKAARARFLYRRGRLVKVPADPFSLLFTPLLSPGARLRLVRGLFYSGKGSDEEETIEQVASRRVGVEATDTLISAVVSGIFGGDIHKLSLPACFPSVARVDRQARSLVGYGIAQAFRGGRTKGGKPRRRWRGLVSIDAGLGGLMEALGATLGDDLRTGIAVREIRALERGESDGARYELLCRTNAGNDETWRCRRLVLATPAPASAELLEGLVPDAAADLRGIESVSLCVLNLGFSASDISHDLRGFGFLVPRNEPDLPVMGILWADSIFPHHVPEGKRLIRVFVGGARDPGAVDRNDAQLLDAGMNTARKLLGIRGDPMLVDVSRWREAIPQYYPGHVERIRRVRTAVAARQGLFLVGNYLDGVSLNDCIRLGTVTGERIAEDIAGTLSGVTHQQLQPS